MFEVRDNIVYWKSRRLKGKKAGGLCDGRIEIRFIEDGQLHRLKAHQIIFCLEYGFIPDKIDHIDRNPLNNDINNLREATQQINMINTGLQKNNTSGCKGVCYQHNAWVVGITFNQKDIYLGRFKNKSDAFAIRKMAEEILWSDLLNYKGELLSLHHI